MKRLLMFVLVVALSTVTHASTPLPTDSVLRLPGQFVDQDGQAFTLAARRGHPQLVAMFYTSCPYMCPLIIDTGLAIDATLTPAERAKLRVLLISIDPERDSPAVLRAMTAKRHLDVRRWTLARTDDRGVRNTAAVLGVRYRRLADGEFNHSSVLVLLDADGRILARTEKMGRTPDPAFVNQVRAQLK